MLKFLSQEISSEKMERLQFILEELKQLELNTQLEIPPKK